MISLRRLFKARSAAVCGQLIVVGLVMFGCQVVLVNSNPDAKRLYDDLLRKNKYSLLIRPVSDHMHNLTVNINLKLSQLIDVDEKNEIITTNVWLMQKWTDSSLIWDPNEYGGVDMLYVPSEDIWRPDIVLYNNADGDYIITMMTKATIRNTGVVEWEPPAIYKSQCDIDVEYFPFDEQRCKMKFGDWTYHGNLVDVRHMWNFGSELDWVVHNAIDLTAYYDSVEWDLMNVTAKKTNIYYPCCNEPYPDVTFHIHIRRKILYYTINLIIPCVSINLMTLLVFYLPADCGEKISICISIMLSLSLFQLLLMELVPGTSLVTPLIGKYLLFTCILVSISVCMSVVVLNITQHSAATHSMSPFVHRFFLNTLPRLLCMARPAEAQRADVDFSQAHSELLPFDNPYKKATTRPKYDSSAATAAMELGMKASSLHDSGVVCEACARRRLHRYPPNVHKALDSIVFIANHLASADDARRVKDDWKFLAKVIDRILLYAYFATCFAGGLALLLRAPSLYDKTPPLTPIGK